MLRPAAGRCCCTKSNASPRLARLSLSLPPHLPPALHPSQEGSAAEPAPPQAAKVPPLSHGKNDQRGKHVAGQLHA